MIWYTLYRDHLALMRVPPFSNHHITILLNCILNDIATFTFYFSVSDYVCTLLKKIISCQVWLSYMPTLPDTTTTIFLLLPRPFLLSPSPSPSGTLWTRSRRPCAYLSKMAKSALAARAKIRLPCALKHRVQQEYNNLRVNHNYNKIVKSDWLSTALISALVGQFNRTVRVMPK